MEVTIEAFITTISNITAVPYTKADGSEASYFFYELQEITLEGPPTNMKSQYLTIEANRFQFDEVKKFKEGDKVKATVLLGGNKLYTSKKTGAGITYNKVQLIRLEKAV